MVTALEDCKHGYIRHDVYTYAIIYGLLINAKLDFLLFWIDMPSGNWRQLIHLAINFSKGLPVANRWLRFVVDKFDPWSWNQFISIYGGSEIDDVFPWPLFYHQIDDITLELPSKL